VRESRPAAPAGLTIGVESPSPGPLLSWSPLPLTGMSPLHLPFTDSQIPAGSDRASRARPVRRSPSCLSGRGSSNVEVHHHWRGRHGGTAHGTSHSHRQQSCNQGEPQGIEGISVHGTGKPARAARKNVPGARCPQFAAPFGTWAAQRAFNSCWTSRGRQNCPIPGQDPASPRAPAGVEQQGLAVVSRPSHSPQATQPSARLSKRRASLRSPLSRRPKAFYHQTLEERFFVTAILPSTRADGRHSDRLKVLPPISSMS